ncbi:hypothetical protein AO073_15265 [Pseudomonas syringae ICMP 11293]|uniref:hypothetical protein n=1 Tax=Pseudomonas syringae TaxID=317 RepID=UPI0007316E34|nr:hypothetical protein [Pseudomonas syringae]KTB95208.1 hypothetical protein AO073_15265 [Pseudomonas syringae ICMP 11293]
MQNWPANTVTNLEHRFDCNLAVSQTEECLKVGSTGFKAVGHFMQRTGAQFTIVLPVGVQKRLARGGTASAASVSILTTKDPISVPVAGSWLMPCSALSRH